MWNVPPHNPHFTGRGTELAAAGGGPGGRVGGDRASLHGLGGVGKTQLAAEYAHAHAGDYDVVWWVAAEEPASVPDQFSALAAALGLEPAADPEALPAQVHEALRGDGGVAAGVRQRGRGRGHRGVGAAGAAAGRGSRACHRHHPPRRVRRPGGGDGPGRDRPGGCGGAAAHPGPGPGPGPGEAIAAELGRLPLALEQAAAYMDRAQVPGGEYLELLRSRAAELYARGRVSSRTDTVATLWNVSLDRSAAESPAAVQLLEVCAYLAPEPVPLDLFTAHPGLLPAPLSAAAADKLAFTEAVGVLVDYSLATRTRGRAAGAPARPGRRPRPPRGHPPAAATVRQASR